jgi:hypothetical protein
VRSCRSVRGLSLDFQMLNLLGFACYAAYNVSLAYVPAVRAQYRAAFSNEIPVGLEDVLFAVNALLATCLTMAQCLIYDRGEQSFFTPLGRTAMLLGGACALAVGFVAGVQVSGAAAQWAPFLNWVNLLLGLSVCKLVVSLIKYIPQVGAHAEVPLSACPKLRRRTGPTTEVSSPRRVQCASSVKYACLYEYMAVSASQTLASDMWMLLCLVRALHLAHCPPHSVRGPFAG